MVCRKPQQGGSGRWSRPRTPGSLFSPRKRGEKAFKGEPLENPQLARSCFACWRATADGLRRALEVPLFSRAVLCSMALL